MGTDLLPALLCGHGARSPHAVALLDADRSVTYGELVRQARGVADRIRRLGIERGDRVAVLLPNSADAVAVMYGAWLAGAVVVPLNVQSRGLEAAARTRHAEARLLVHDTEYRDCEEALAALDPKSTMTVATSELLPGTGRDEAPAELPLPPAAHELAMILYTSGTTGAPKGVMLSHGNLAANVASIVTYLSLTRYDRVLSVLPFCYAYGNSVLHTHLAAGGCVVIERNFLFPHVVLETMMRTRVTGFSGVPSTFALLLARVRLDPAALPTLRYITQAGAAMSPAQIANLRAALPGVQLFIMYGQTEATARLTYLPPARLAEKSGSVGIPIPGVELEVRDVTGQRAPKRITGDIWVRGPNVMQGYWRDEGATRRVLQGGWLCTGDLGHVDEEGFLYLVGRRSDVIKTGAHRVHPREIEDVVAEVHGVGEVLVLGEDDELLGQAIVAYVVPDPDAALTADLVEAHCRAKLASYKIPKRVEIVEGLPRTDSGKVRRFDLAVAGGNFKP